jgi:DNA ligase-4
VVCALTITLSKQASKHSIVYTVEYTNLRCTGADPMTCLSFFKVGGGFRSGDYAKIYHQTEGKWHKWDRNNPPKDLIVLGGNEHQQLEKPDEWIKPCDSVVLEVKAASVSSSEQYGFQYSLRFPRFKRLRDDKTWREALSTYEFVELKNRVEEENKNKEIKVDTSRRATKRLKKEVVIAGNDTRINTYAGPKTKAFEGLNFCVLSGMDYPVNKSKGEIEQIIKNNGGSIFQSPNAQDNIICIGEKRVVKVASLIKSGHTNIVKPAWVLDALKQVEIDGLQRQRFLVPFEPAHMFHMLEDVRDNIEGAVDDYGDSYAKDVSVDDLRHIMDDMIRPKKSDFSATEFLSQLEDHGNSFGEVPGLIFRRRAARFLFGETEESSIQLQIAKNRFLFGGGTVAESDEDDTITHFILLDSGREQVKSLRARIAKRGTRIPRVVSLSWLSDSWTEKTVLDEEQYGIVN